MSKDANSAITEFLSKIAHLDEANKAEVLGAIFGAKQAGKVRILADRLTELKSAYAIANDAKSARANRLQDSKKDGYDYGAFLKDKNIKIDDKYLKPKK